MKATDHFLVSNATIPTIRRAGVTGVFAPTVVPGYSVIVVPFREIPLIHRIAKTVTSGIIWKIPRSGTKVTTLTIQPTSPTTTTAQSGQPL